MGCPHGGPIDFNDSCVRTSWSALLPAMFITIACIVTALWRRTTSSRMACPGPWLLTRFLTVREAECLEVSDAEENSGGPSKASQSELINAKAIWKNVAITFIALMEALIWLCVGCFTLVAHPGHLWDSVSSLIIAATWLYPTFRAAVRPSATPPWDLFVLFILQLAIGLLRLGGTLRSDYIHDAQISPSVIVGLIFNLVAVICLLGVTVSMPLAVPSDHVKTSEIVSVTFVIYKFVVKALVSRVPLCLRKTIPLFGAGYHSHGYIH